MSTYSNSSVILNMILNTFVLTVVCTWGQWSGWSACSKTCGGGRRARFSRDLTLSCNRQTQTGLCNTKRCRGES